MILPGNENEAPSGRKISRFPESQSAKMTPPPSITAHQQQPSLHGQKMGHLPNPVFSQPLAPQALLSIPLNFSDLRKSFHHAAHSMPHLWTYSRQSLQPTWSDRKDSRSRSVATHMKDLPGWPVSNSKLTADVPRKSQVTPSLSLQASIASSQGSADEQAVPSVPGLIQRSTDRPKTVVPLTSTNLLNPQSPKYSQASIPKVAHHSNCSGAPQLSPAGHLQNDPNAPFANLASKGVLQSGNSQSLIRRAIQRKAPELHLANSGPSSSIINHHPADLNEVPHPPASNKPQPVSLHRPLSGQHLHPCETSSQKPLSETMGFSKPQPQRTHTVIAGPSQTPPNNQHLENSHGKTKHSVNPEINVTQNQHLPDEPSTATLRIQLVPLYRLLEDKFKSETDRKLEMAELKNAELEKEALDKIANMCVKQELCHEIKPKKACKKTTNTVPVKTEDGSSDNKYVLSIPREMKFHGPPPQWARDLFLLPLLKGWRRLVVDRVNPTALSDPRKKHSDVYYFSPDHTKLRSRREIGQYLMDNGITEFEAGIHFCWYKFPLGGEFAPYETNRPSKPHAVKTEPGSGGAELEGRVSLNGELGGTSTQGEPGPVPHPVVTSNFVNEAPSASGREDIPASHQTMPPPLDRKPAKRPAKQMSSSSEIDADTQVTSKKSKCKEKIFCICSDIAHGSMIECDNAKCPIGWYHFGCVGLQNNPDVCLWFCPICRGETSQVLNSAYFNIPETTNSM